VIGTEFFSLHVIFCFVLFFVNWGLLIFFFQSSGLMSDQIVLTLNLVFYALKFC
jgi:hypothetical protein